MGNIITVNLRNTCCGKEAYYTGEKLYQYDYGQILKVDGVALPASYEVHFSNSAKGTSTTSIGTADGVAIPDQYLQHGGKLYVWIYLHTGEDDGETEYGFYIPILSRAQPTHEEPTPVQQSEIEQLIAQLENYENDAEQSVEEAEDMATLAESWARGGTGTRSGEDTDNARHYAELAAQSAESSGYIWCDVDQSTGQLIVTTTEDLYNEMRLGINENTGELVVTVL